MNSVPMVAVHKSYRKAAEGELAPTNFAHTDRETFKKYLATLS